MPPRYLANRRRRPTYRRKGPRKGYRMGIRKRYKKSYKKVVEFKRTCNKLWTTNSAGGTNDGLIRVSAASAQNIQYTFQLSDLPDYTEITTLYDQYKIKAISLRFVPFQNSADINPNASVVYAQPIHSVLDFTDTTNLATLNDYMEYSTYKMTKGLRDHRRYLYPKQIVYALDEGASVLADVQNKWLRSESPGVDHLGVKVHIPQALATTSTIYQVFATFYVLAKQVK